MQIDVSAAGSADRGVPRFVETWRRVLRRKWTVVACVVVAVTLTALGLKLTPPTYRATAILLIEQGPARMMSLEQAGVGVMLNREYFMSQAEFLRSKDVARRTIAAIGLRSAEDFAAPGLLAAVRARVAAWWPARPEATAARGDGHDDDRMLVAFQRRLTVEPLRQSQLIAISFDSDDPALAARVANTIAQEYMQADMDARYTMTQQATLWLSRKLSELRAKLDDSEQALQAYRERQGLVRSSGTPQSGPQRELEELTQRLVEARVRRTQVEQQYNQVRPNAANRYEVQAVQSNAAVARARQAEAEAERAHAEAARRYGPNFPAYKAAAAELQLARENTQRLADAVIAGIVKEYEAARAAEVSLERSLTGARAALQEVNRKEITLSAYEREAATNRQLYQTFLERVNQAAASADVRSAPGRVIDPAIAPSQPIAPRKGLVLVAALGVSLLVGCLAALLRARLDNTLNAADEVERATGLPLLSAIPLTRRRRGDPALGHLMLEDPNSLYADSVRLALTGIQLSGLDTPRHVTAVTSSIQGEGKSTVALSLALACARSRRTILVDADIRKPGLGGVSGLAGGERGLADFVRGEAPLRDCIRPLAGGPLEYMPGGRVDPAGSLELFSGPGYLRLLAELRRSYDAVFVDCPPLNPVADGFVIGRHSDGVVLVVRAHSTPVQVVQATLARLASTSVTTLGVVLNAYDARIARAYYGDESGHGRYAYRAGDRAEPARPARTGRATA